MAGDASMRDVVWGGDFFAVEQHQWRDADGKPLNNTAETYYDPFVVHHSYPTLTLSYSTTSVSMRRRAERCDTVNSDALWVFQPRELYLGKWIVELRYGRDDAAFVWNYLEFYIRLENNEVPGWQRRVPNVGPVQLEDSEATTPEARYKTIDATASDGGIIPSTNYILNNLGKWAPDQSSAGFVKEFKDWKETAFAGIFPGDTAPTFPTALTAHPT